MRVHKSAALFSAAALLLSTGGCEKSERGSAAGSREPDIAAMKQAIREDQERWNEEYQAKPKSFEKLMAHYAPDAYIVPSGLNPISGELNIRSLVGTMVRDPNFEMTFASDQIEVARSGDLAYARGRYSDRYTDPATKQVRSEAGSYLTVYKKQEDGSWKVIEDFSVKDAAPQPPPK